MLFVLSLMMGLARGQSAAAHSCENLLRFSFELTTYPEISALVSTLPEARRARLRYGRAPDLRGDAGEVFAEFRDEVWRHIWVADREVEADDWTIHLRFERAGTHRATAPVGRALRLYGQGDEVQYAQRILWTERGSDEGIPRPALRYDFAVRGNRRLLSRRDRALIEQLQTDPTALAEPWTRLRTVAP